MSHSSKRPAHIVAHGVLQVWSFVNPKTKSRYRDFWLSNAFYKPLGPSFDPFSNGFRWIRDGFWPRISRVRHEPRCLVPFIASRALALTNLDWIEQWEIFQHPRRARQHHNFQLRAIVDAIYAMIQEVPLEPRLSYCTI